MPRVLLLALARGHCLALIFALVPEITSFGTLARWRACEMVAVYCTYVRVYMNMRRESFTFARALAAWERRCALNSEREREERVRAIEFQLDGKWTRGGDKLPERNLN